jgi:hypothetical protein
MWPICHSQGRLARLATILAMVLLTASATKAVPPPPSPGLSIAKSTYDLQHVQSMGREVARLAGNDCVHFVWTAWDRIPTDMTGNTRYVGYNSFTISTGTLNQGFGGVVPGTWDVARAGFPEVAVDDGDLSNIALFQRQDPSLPYRPWRAKMPIACNALHIDDELGVPVASDVIWPKLEVQLGSAQGIVHEIAHDADYPLATLQRVYYWRNANGIWSGPVLIDSNFTIAHVVAAAPNSDRCAIVLFTDREPQLGGALNIAYYESQTAGAGWLDYSELGDANKHIITNYTDRGGPQAWRHISAVYEDNDALNIIWDERQDTLTTACIIRQWNSVRASIRPVTYGLWSNRRASTGGVDLSLAKMTIGVGDGATTCSGESNLNYLYVLYTRFGGPTPAEKGDSSKSGFMNGELYLNVSRDGGETWSPPTNLTNTKTPHCFPEPADTLTGIPPKPDSVCRSEHWASLNKIVHDLDILFISDMDPGAITYGEGTWQQNPVMYLRLPGATVNAAYVCPASGPQMAASFQPANTGGCGLNASGSQTVHSNLSIANAGNTNLQGQVSVVYTNPPNPAVPWLTLPGGQSAPFDLAPGSANLNMDVVMTAQGLARGSYLAELHVTHNDATLPSPQVIAISFNADPCACHANPVCDTAIDILDVTAVIDYAFRGAARTIDPFCPSPLAATIDGTTDVNCSSETDVLDVVLMIGVAFRGANPATSFCHPCAMVP